MPEFLLTPISLNNLASLLLSVAIIAYLITLKQKDKASWFFILYMMLFSIFFIRNFLLFSVNSPGNIRLFLSGMIFTYISVFMTVPWAYFSYKNIHKKESIVSITLCLILLIISCVMIIHGSYKNPVLFRFHNQTHLVLTNPFVGATAGIFLLLTLSVFIRKQIKFNEAKENCFKTLLMPKGKVSIAFRNFSLYILFSYQYPYNGHN